MRRLVLGIAVAVTSLMPVVGVADDQKIADFIKSRLQAEQQQGNLQGFNVDMRVEEGTVWFKGHVANASQEMTILKSAQAAGHLGVIQVVDEIEVTQSATPAFNSQAIPAAAPETAPAMRQVAFQQPSAGSVPAKAVSARMAPPSPTSSYMAEPMPMPINGGYSAGPAPMGPPMGGSPMGGSMGSPMGAPMAAGMNGGTMASGSPSLPGYAWPSYAAHPNFGNVSYPQQYSPSAWPYIGPFYPYPQVPLGWRKVTLEWDDGFWMLDFHDK